MIKKLLYLIVLLPFVTFSQTLIPDPIFEQRLIDLNLDDVIDGEVLTSNINTITSLNVSSAYSSTIKISDLTGIEDFTLLETLNCYNNSLTTIDLTKNLNLISLNCVKNSLTSLNVDANIKLKSLDFNENQGISAINLTKNVALERVSCYYTQISSFDLTKNLELTYFQCAYAPITALDVSKNLKLITLSVQSTDIISIDVSKNIKLTLLHCAWTPLTSLDVSKLVLLETLHTSVSKISSLDLSKNVKLKTLGADSSRLETLNLKNGNNSNMTTISYANNGLLTCIEVDDPVYSAANWSDNNGTITFSVDCSTLSVQEIENSEFNIYPNPASNNIQITLNAGLELQVAVVYNLMGQPILKSREKVIDISSLSTGIYYVEITTNQGKGVKKVIVK